jgi:hypothetical protein
MMSCPLLAIRVVRLLYGSVITAEDPVYIFDSFKRTKDARQRAKSVGASVSL